MGSTCSVIGWHGRPILDARSIGSGVFAAFDWRDLVLHPGPEIVSKAAVASRHASAFTEADLCRLRQCDNRYTDVQSLQSEDSVTWSTFGPHVPPSALATVVDAAFGIAGCPRMWQPTFWRRLPHPDGTGGGPEADLMLEATDNWCFAIEAKWLSDLKSKQGKGTNRTQLEMRADSIAAKGSALGRRGSLVIVPGPQQYPRARTNSVFATYFAVDGDRYQPRESALQLEARAITWNQIAALLEQIPEAKEAAIYLRWRLSHLRP